jgi:drug/metabolite transporter (DMT)-like permease
MINSYLSSILGLGAALAWGGSDFAGGLSAKRTSVWWVVLLSQAVGLLFLIFLTILYDKSLPLMRDLLLGALAGFIGEFGLIMLYQGLATGRMGVVAPLSAILSALLPACVGMFIAGMPIPTQLAGNCLALPAVWLVSTGSEHGRAKTSELLLGLGAGLAFGIYFILIAQFSSRAIYWPLTAARLTSLIVMLLLVMTFKPIPRPALRNLPLITMAGILDSTGNIFFALATRTGRLDVAAVLSSLYPAVTILLAYFLLKERLVLKQWVGVGLALTAIFLITI